jgi:hypothetical protein
MSYIYRLYGSILKAAACIEFSDEEEGGLKLLLYKLGFEVVKKDDIDSKEKWKWLA